MSLDADRRQQLVRRYVESMPSKIASLRQARERFMANGDDGPSRILAHKLIGSGASYGFPRVSAVARGVELAAAAALAEELDRLIGVLVDIERAHRLDEKPTVLVVEDDGEVSRLVTELLTPVVAEVRAASSAADAEGAIAAGGIDVIVLDLVLPDDDGRELLQRLRTHELSANIPVIVLSAWAEEARRDCVALGADHVLHKSGDPELLVTSVLAAFARHRDWVSGAHRDPLTGIWNRAGFQAQVARARSSCERTDSPLSIGFIDVDNFKNINDELGHAAGDAALRTIGRVLRSGTRESDVVGRWGGDEFAVALPHTNEEQAVVALRKLQQELVTAAADDDPALRPTFSAGVVQILPDEELEETLIRADRMLYHAKAQGRNRVFGEGCRPTTASPRILVAEDDADVADLLRRVLEREGYDIDIARDGAEAIEAAGRVRYDLVIVDWHMPRRRGDAVIRELRNQRSYAQVPIVCVTTQGDDDTIESAFMLGADDYILKPFRGRPLVARLRRHLVRR